MTSPTLRGGVHNTINSRFGVGLVSQRSSHYACVSRIRRQRFKSIARGASCAPATPEQLCLFDVRPLASAVALPRPLRAFPVNLGFLRCSRWGGAVTVRFSASGKPRTEVPVLHLAQAWLEELRFRNTSEDAHTSPENRRQRHEIPNARPPFGGPVCTLVSLRLPNQGLDTQPKTDTKHRAPPASSSSVREMFGLHTPPRGVFASTESLTLFAR